MVHLVGAGTPAACLCAGLRLPELTTLRARTPYEPDPFEPMNRFLSLVVLSLLSTSCITTRHTHFEPSHRVLLETRDEEGAELRYNLVSTKQGIPQVVRTRTSVSQVASLGLRVRAIDNRMAQTSALTPWRGVLVERVQASSPAARAGILVGDVLLSLGGIELSAPEQLEDIVKSDLGPEAEVQATLLQIAPDGSYPVSTKDIPVKLGSRDVTTSKSDVFPLGCDKGVFRLTGLQAGSLPMELSEEIYGDSEPVVLVAGTLVGSPAYLAGLRTGDRLLTCDGKRVQSHEELSRALLARTDHLDLPAHWFDASSRRDLPGASEAKGKILLEVDGPLGPHLAELDWVRDLDDESSFEVPILFEYESDVDSTRWSFLDFIFQFGANYHGRYRESKTRATESTWLYSILPFGMFEFERTTRLTRYRFFWFITFQAAH